MTTRELIEAVDVVARYDQCTVDDSSQMLPFKDGFWVEAADYDALRAACAAVLDEVDEAMSFLLSSDVTDKQCLRARDNARALRERVKG